MKISDFFALTRLPRQMHPRPCPVCRARDGVRLLRYDRYFLPADITECRQCGMIYCARMLSPPALETFYISLYSRLMDFKAKTAQNAVDDSKARIRLAKLSAQLGPFERVLEIGGG